MLCLYVTSLQIQLVTLSPSNLTDEEILLGGGIGTAIFLSPVLHPVYSL